MQSATAIGFLAGFLTLIGLVISVGAVRAVAQEPHDGLKLIPVGLVIWASALFSWHSFWIQRRAGKLRQARGLSLIEPTAAQRRRPTPVF